MPKRLYFFSGKGGVGKSTLSLCFARYLNECHQQKVQVISFEGTSPCNPCFPLTILELNDCAHEYIANKLGSKIVSKWVIHSAFFKALINMIPGFSYLIYLGKILKLLDSDPKLTIIVDAPATGHLLTMFDSIKNFQNIFKAGLLYNDTLKMNQLLNSKDFAQVNILSLPQKISVIEAKELAEKLSQLYQFSVKTFINYTLALDKDSYGEVPPQLLQKIQFESTIIEEETQNLDGVLPFVPESQQENQYREFKNKLEVFI